MVNWLTEKNAVNEVAFCEEFFGARPLKCIGGKLYDIDGVVSDSDICYEYRSCSPNTLQQGFQRR